MTKTGGLWSISTDVFINESESIMRSGNVYQIANGYMGYRGTLDEFGPQQLVGITLAGIFDRAGDAWREPVNAPNGGFTEIALDGRRISALTTTIRKHWQGLNLRNAMFERETGYASGGKILTVKSSRFLSADRPNLGVIKFSLEVNKTARVCLRTGIDCNIWDLNGPHLTGFALQREAGVMVVDAVTSELSRRVAVAEIADFDFGQEVCEIRNRRHLRRLEFKAEPGKTYGFCKYFAVQTDYDPIKISPRDAAIRCVREAKMIGYDGCLQRHNAQWEKKWEYCDVRIDGDTEAQQALRYSIFQLLIAAPINGSANSIPARALSGQVYKGAIFWDTEMFMFPFFLHAYPEKAAELMRYRIKTLEGARRKARSEGTGYRGAFYAWESQETGDDACTYFNIGDPVTKRQLRTHFRDKQVHISGDVAIAMWEYFKVTGDESLLLNGGAEVILECARFYYSYAYFKPDKQRYEILDVIGPDEYHERVNNNAFTNMVAKATFETANTMVRHLKRHHPDALQALVKKLRIAGELPLFVEMADRLYVPLPDKKTGVIEQFDGYFRLMDATVGELKARMLHPDEYWGAAQGLAVSTKVIKQADVVTMLNLFGDRYSEKTRTANWEYYEPRTEHGSSLSACAYSICAVGIGKLDWAYRYFLKTAKIDIEAKYKVRVGTIFMGGSHPAANGGAWMAAVLGFGGVKAHQQHVTINPRLYPKWRSLEFNIVYKSSQFRIRITRTEVVLAANPSNQRRHQFIVGGKSVNCEPGQVCTIKYGNRNKSSQATELRSIFQ